MYAVAGAMKALPRYTAEAGRINNRERGRGSGKEKRPSRGRAGGAGARHPENYLLRSKTHARVKTDTLAW